MELSVPPRRESLCGATPGKHRRLGPEPVGGSAFSCRRLRLATPRREPSQERDRWFESGFLHRRVRKLSVPLRHDAPFDCGGRALAMFYHTVVLESGDVVIALEADSNRSPLEKGHAIRRADRDGLLSGCPANSKMTVGPLVRIRFIESADRGGHQRSARADDRQFNRVAGPRGRCDSSLRAFARSSAVRSGLSPVSQDAKRARDGRAGATAAASARACTRAFDLRAIPT